MTMPVGTAERAAAGRELSAELWRSVVLLGATVGLMGLLAAALVLLTTRPGG